MTQVKALKSREANAFQMHGWARLGACLLLVIGASCASHELSLPPGKCTAFKFVVPGATQFSVSLDGGNFPSECPPKEALNITHFWRKGKCVDYKWWNLLCKNYISDADQVCLQWSKLTQYFSPTNVAVNPNMQQISYWECGEIEYYMAFTSSCSLPAILNVNVNIGALGDREAKFCNIAGDYGKSLFEQTTISRVVVIVVGVLIVYLLFSLLICTQAPCCNLYVYIKGHKSVIDEIEEELLEEDEEETIARREKRKRRPKPHISTQPSIPE